MGGRHGHQQLVTSTLALRSIVGLTLLLGLACAGCSFSGLNHKADQSLREELEERGAKEGLALGRLTSVSTALEVYDFGGRRRVFPVPLPKNVPTGWTILPTCLIAIDAGAGGTRQEYGTLILMDFTGHEISKSTPRLHSGSAFALSRDFQSVAFVGLPAGASFEFWGIYTAKMQGDEIRRLAIIPPVPAALRMGDPSCTTR